MQQAVLLVDDDRNLLHGLARALRRQPYTLYTATSAEEAMSVLKSRKVDVVVSDEHMPGMCGGDLMAWTANHCPEVTRIVLTGHPTVENAVRAINEGRVYQFFTKPCDPILLAMTIRKALEHRELVRETDRLTDLNRRHEEARRRCRQDVGALRDVLSAGVREPLRQLVNVCESLEELFGHQLDPPPTKLTDLVVQGLAEAERLADALSGPTQDGHSATIGGQAFDETRPPVAGGETDSPSVSMSLTEGGHD
jgi:response regulator RpfG family c-di-GMP phosphodiesterase